LSARDKWKAELGYLCTNTPNDAVLSKSRNDDSDAIMRREMENAGGGRRIRKKEAGRADRRAATLMSSLGALPESQIT